MTTTLTLTDAEVSVLASALHREHDHLSKLRATAERRLTDEDSGAPRAQYVDFTRAACIEECDLAALDSVVGKLPEWVAGFIAQMGRS